MSDVDTGGQAYPGNHSYVDGYPSEWEGLTMRDRAAIEALPNSLERSVEIEKRYEGGDENDLRIAKRAAYLAYLAADALITRKRETDPKPRAYDAAADRPF
ncbi:hypothetical protein [Rhizobium leguminosarum]|uniref:hypothetical protein n=1 Tax=Rhizobium leguminosarum TaxID=384 RepID=UPI000B928C57|nr:hypothetical protein [Rhizobium leguminosarum]ASS55883.1 hypothetical protein CHR56_15650 [Rhizobium leguminosarum bv. viciae]